MNYCRQFDQFDPLTEVVPLMPFVAMRDIAVRSRRLLNEITSAQINELAETVEWIIDSAVTNTAKQAEENGDAILHERLPLTLT